MSETKAAFAERTIRSLKKILYRYMEFHGYNYIQKLSQLVHTLISREICSIGLISKKVKKSDIFFITTSHQENFENHSLVLETDSSSRSKTHPSKKAISHGLRNKFFEFVALSSTKLPTNTKSVEPDENIRLRFYRKKSIKAI